MLLTSLKGNTPKKTNLSKFKICWEEKRASNFQFQVKSFFKQYWQFHEVYEEMRLPGSLLRLDLFNATMRIAVEASGEQHFKFNEHFHKNRLGYGASVIRDDSKARWLEKNNIILIELRTKDLPLLSPAYISEKFGVEIT